MLHVIRPKNRIEATPVGIWDVNFVANQVGVGTAWLLIRHANVIFFICRVPQDPEVDVLLCQLCEAVEAIQWQSIALDTEPDCSVYCLAYNAQLAGVFASLCIGLSRAWIDAVVPCGAACDCLTGKDGDVICDSIRWACIVECLCKFLAISY